MALLSCVQPYYSIVPSLSTSPQQPYSATEKSNTDQVGDMKNDLKVEAATFPGRALGFEQRKPFMSSICVTCLQKERYSLLSNPRPPSPLQHSNDQRH